MRAGDRGWSRSQLERAQPYPLPQAEPTRPGQSVPMRATGEGASNSPAEPTVSSSMSRMEEREAPAPLRQNLEEEGGQVSPDMVSAFDYPFTTIRTGPRLITRDYPYATVGKLFFESAGGGRFSCSGAMIDKRLVITAAHCMWDHQEDDFYSNFRFFPAYDGTRSFLTPYCQWAAEDGIVPWEYTADDSVVNEYDFGILQLRDRNCRQYGEVSAGELTGWLGWASHHLIGNNITELGYPGNLDSGQVMQKTHSDVVLNDDTGQIGSAQSGGSSGGPWVQNFGIHPDGIVPIGDGSFDQKKTVVAVKSYGFVDHDAFQVGGASILNDAWERIWDNACDWEWDNC